MTRKIELTGQRFGRLVVLADAGRNKQKALMWLCRCDCGNESTVVAACLRSGHTTSCGCYKRERIIEGSSKHGQSSTRLYKVWRSMVRRATEPTYPDYPRYGGRGISVCDEWRESFEAFARDMGPTYSEGLTLDRIDNDGNYEPGNCRWATAIEQARNKRSNRLLTFNGKTMPMSAWAEHTGIRRNAIQSRLGNGWSVERALTEPVQERNNEALTVNGETLPIAVWAKRSGISRKTIAERIGRGWPAERAVIEPPRKFNRSRLPTP